MIRKRGVGELSIMGKVEEIPGAVWSLCRRSKAGKEN
jgi:hypothetical protein